MWSALFTALAGFLASVIRDAIADFRQSATLKDLGRAEGAVETTTIIAERADAQAKVNAVDRGSAGDVARRLRERLAKPGAH